MSPLVMLFPKIQKGEKLYFPLLPYKYFRYMSEFIHSLISFFFQSFQFPFCTSANPLIST